jgi:37-kD nucleoid-associated bacterial protein
MTLENLTIGRICLHEVYRRSDERTIVPPAYGTGLLHLEGKARDAFNGRVLAAFRSDAKCMEMAIARHGPGSAANVGVALLSSNDAQFIQDSRALADLLAGAQISRAIPGGVVAVFDGTVGHPARRFFGLMKAELHEGFLKQQNLQATFVDSLFLSPKTKLYKIGLFVENQSHKPRLPDDYSATVYDSQLTSAQRESAALYFHDTFLGLEITADAAYQVRQFFENTKEFISTAPVDDEQKVDLYNSLYTYLKVDQSPTVQVGEFADSYMTPELGEAYRLRMRKNGVPTLAIPKDLKEVAGRLRLRRLRFPRRIMLSGPPEAMSELVRIEAIDGDSGTKWTRITVRAQIEDQE